MNICDVFSWSSFWTKSHNIQGQSLPAPFVILDRLLDIIGFTETIQWLLTVLVYTSTSAIDHNSTNKGFLWLLIPGCKQKLHKVADIPGNDSSLKQVILVYCFGGGFRTRNGKTPMARRKSSWTRQSFYPIRFLGVFLRLGNLNWLQEMRCLDLNTARSEKHIYGKLNVIFFNTCCQMCKCEKGMSSRCDLIHPDRSMAEPMSMPRLYLLIGKIWDTLRGSRTTRCFRRLVFQKKKVTVIDVIASGKWSFNPKKHFH